MNLTLQATGAMRLGIERLLSKYALAGALAASWKLEPSEEIKTMAVAADGVGIKLLFCPDFVLSITLDELVGVLHHEARHCIYGHIYLNPDDYPDEHALLIAEEVSVNENMPEPLPGQPYTLKSFPMLPPDEDTLKRYQRLAKKFQAQRNQKSKNSSNQHGAQTKQSSADAATLGAHDRTDDHSTWGSFRKNESVTKANIEQVLREALRNDLNAAEREAETLKRAAETCGSTGEEWINGAVISGSIDCELPAGSAAQLNWKTLLRQQIGAISAPRFSYAFPPRRFPHLIGIVPGRRRISNKPVVLAAIDTSSSLDEATLADISAELTALAHDFSVTVVEVDCKIQRVYRFNCPLKRVIGRGGTSFKPVFDPNFLRRINPNVIVYFTDGEGDAPENPPRMPTIWVLTEGGLKPANWGRAVWMHQNPEQST